MGGRVAQARGEKPCNGVRSVHCEKLLDECCIDGVGGDSASSVDGSPFGCRRVHGFSLGHCRRPRRLSGTTSAGFAPLRMAPACSVARLKGSSNKWLYRAVVCGSE